MINMHINCLSDINNSKNPTF